jgi:NADP-dependent 3-hydroxy acid dehydrogenase YdfG
MTIVKPDGGNQRRKIALVTGASRGFGRAVAIAIGVMAGFLRSDATAYITRTALNINGGVYT